MTTLENIARYDDIVPTTVKIVTELCGIDFFDRNLLLRDTDGFITVILRDKLPPELITKASELLYNALENYATKPVIATPDDLFDSSLADQSKDKLELVLLDDGAEIYIRYLERRIVGGDWVRSMQAPIENAPKIVVFSSLKGGVGRSTALSIAAMHLARMGKSILAIDLDLEAPGIGGMFLNGADLPKYGALDFYVEYGRTSISAKFLEDMQKVAYTDASGGAFTIIPATGMASQAFPQNVLGKISRAYLEILSSEGIPLSFLDKTRELISSVCASASFDVIFIDARAGLNETTAATIQGLGADILFFGVDTPQTWEGYRYFFSHLARHKPEADSVLDWRYKLKIVHAKAINNQDAIIKFRDQASELFTAYLYDEVEGDEAAQGLVGSFGFDLDDPTAPHYAWPIFMSSTFYEYSPLDDDTQNSTSVIGPIFGQFLNNLYERLDFQ